MKNIIEKIKEDLNTDNDTKIKWFKRLYMNLRIH